MVTDKRDRPKIIHMHKYLNKYKQITYTSYLLYSEIPPNREESLEQFS